MVLAGEYGNYHYVGLSFLRLFGGLELLADDAIFLNYISLWLPPVNPNYLIKPKNLRE